jgi:hypothetical protein
MNSSILLQSFTYDEKMKICMYLNATMKIQQENEIREIIIAMDGRG